jgi:hypothetical protein
MSKKIFNERMTVEIDGDFVVFIIGAKIRKPWMVHKWLPVALAMPRMIKELQARPESGFLGHIGGASFLVQYWRSFEHLEAYARDRDRQHWPAWVSFYKKIGVADGAVGIWHETYKVRAGEYEAIYGGMPAFGLGKVGRLVPASGKRESARGRIGAQQSSVKEAEPVAGEV